jgi:predicted methyltransferase
MNKRTPLSFLTLVLATSAFGCGASDAAAPTPTTPTAAVTNAPASAAGEGVVDAKLRAAIDGPQRPAAEKARDTYRHPRETLEFFGLQPNMTVVELSPGGGWYTSILAPVLKDQGHLFVAGSDPNGPPGEGTQNARELQARIQKSPDAFGNVGYVVMKRDTELSLGPDGSADMVLTFRNLHNWVEGKATDKILGAAFKVLKHGGVLGLTDHRANANGPTDPKSVGDTGYIPEAEAIRIVTAAGFKLADKSEINANPKDTKDYPKGVWTLPPTYELGDKDHAKYEAIGESDRMTLKFVKP